MQEIQDYSIINYMPQYRDELVHFIKQSHPDYSDVYVEYCVDNASGHFNSTIVLNKDNRIVGCHLCFNTTIKVNGTIMPTVWGHDTFLNLYDRKYIGLDFVLAIGNSYAMGIGLTDVNEKIHKKAKTPVLESLYNIFSFSILTPYYYLVNHKPKDGLQILNDISIEKFVFSVTTDVHDIKIINDGFWYEDSIDADLYRGADFLEARFFNNRIHKYYVFRETSYNAACYFVVRPIFYKSIPALLLVDFRYDTSIPNLLESLLRATRKIASRNKIGLVMTTIGDEKAIGYYKKFFTIKRKNQIVYGKKLLLNSESVISVTPADSDIDFHR